MFFSVSNLEVCTQSQPDSAWTKGSVDAEVQVEAATPAGCDKEVSEDVLQQHCLLLCTFQTVK